MYRGRKSSTEVFGVAGINRPISAVVHAANSMLALVLQSFVIEQVRWAYVRDDFCYFLELLLHFHP